MDTAAAHPATSASLDDRTVFSVLARFTPSIAPPYEEVITVAAVDVRDVLTQLSREAARRGEEVSVIGCIIRCTLGVEAGLEVPVG